MYNDTIANMPTGVRIEGEPIEAPGSSRTNSSRAQQHFYNDAIGVDEEGVNGS